jgi:RNA polymerase sigma factor (sigma-70 family)
MGENLSINYLRIYRMAKSFASKYGLGEEAEDFAQWLVLQKLQGKGLYQQIKHSLVDYYRATGRSKRAASFVASNKFVEYTEEPIEKDVVMAESSRRMWKHQEGTFTEPLEIFDRRMLEKLVVSLKPTQRMVMEMYFFQDLNLKEIGKKLRVTESRVSQILRPIKKKLKNCLDPDL